ncbi:hypothetical protein [Sphingobium yanoikuyae]|uniref:Uncharacterized protein n=1 Tax=Sphingobium yanoikuyae TaxID=13690 RepID=A0A0J9CTY2_SPHYA|nr:hypothetical protein [Sphingobium yanoikuyae]ATP17580.1 hypothetical protein BV87_03695 [Sphingobium yanoikuyae]KMW28588.1 hypothetical protein BV87_19685 [Sphingobium yanoikuyae]
MPLIDDALHRTLEAYLDACLAPTLAEWGDADWDRHGWQALERIAAWASLDEFNAMKPYAPPKGVKTARDALAKVARVPTPRAWVPARHSFARTELGAPACFVRFYKEVPGRYLCSFPSEARQRFSRETWRALLRYLGVSWEPKIWAFDEDIGAEFSAPNEWDFWHAQTETLRYRGQDWYLEAFPECLGVDVPASSLKTMIEDVQRAAESLEGDYYKQSNSTTPHQPRPFKSFVQFQLRRTAFLPVRRNIFGTAHAVGSKAYWPKRGIPGVTQNLDLLGIKEPRRAQLRNSVGKALAIRSELPTGWDE